MQWKDSEDSIESNDGEAEAYYEEEYSPLGGKQSGATSHVSRKIGWQVIWVPVAVIILILIYVFLPGGKKSENQAHFIEIQKRLELVEKRMLKLEGVGERVLNLEKSVKDAGALSKRFERLEVSIAKRMDQVDKELIQVRKAVDTKRAKKETTQSVQQKKTATTQTTDHVVKKGETLYSIGRRYGITVDRLRKINKLDKNSAIYVGQKLAVK